MTFYWFNILCLKQIYRKYRLLSFVFILYNCIQQLLLLIEWRQDNMQQFGSHYRISLPLRVRKDKYRAYRDHARSEISQVIDFDISFSLQPTTRTSTSSTDKLILWDWVHCSTGKALQSFMLSLSDDLLQVHYSWRLVNTYTEVETVNSSSSYYLPMKVLLCI